MEDEWELTVDIFSVDLTYETDIEQGARIIHAKCNCDAPKTITDGGDPATQCRHTRQARARIENIFDDREWESLAVAKDAVSINKAPEQWGPLVNEGGN